ncbi:MAG TPA: permease-like cell division protein FtsX [Chitinophagales bacterium]|nr:permease-like cell division protein FtsX [Chitinophagales bacterium]
MANTKGTSYFYAIFGITLVLFVLGVGTILIYEAKKISTGVKENVNVEVVLKDDVAMSKIASLQTHIQAKPYAKITRFVSKEEAAKVLQKDLGEDFLELLGYNPLYASFNLNLYEAYANKDSFEVVKADLVQFAEVKQVNVQTNVLESLDKDVRSGTFVILLIAGALLMFAISLIFNTIRLALYASRFTIKTQQLFGATRWFIIRPFLGRSVWNGFLSGFSACVLIAGLLFYIDHNLPELGLKGDLITFGVLFGAVILFGILISFLSTLTAVYRYLRLKVEDLY